VDRRKDQFPTLLNFYETASLLIWHATCRAIVFLPTPLDRYPNFEGFPRGPHLGLGPFEFFLIFEATLAKGRIYSIPRHSSPPVIPRCTWESGVPSHFEDRVGGPRGYSFLPNHFEISLRKALSFSRVLPSHTSSGEEYIMCLFNTVRERNRGT